MKRRYKLLLIIGVGVSLTMLINFITFDNKKTIVSLGDGLAMGITNNNMLGYSYNDYLKEYIENKNDLDDYNNEFMNQHLTIENLNINFEKNIYGEKTNVPFKQILAKADIITIGIGMDEMVDYSLKKILDSERIKSYINSYDSFLKQLRSFYENDLIIIGLYSVYNIDKSTVFDINKEIKNLALQYKAKFIDVTAIALNKDYFSNNATYYMNYKGHKAIFNLILNTM